MYFVKKHGVKGLGAEVSKQQTLVVLGHARAVGELRQ